MTQVYLPSNHKNHSHLMKYHLNTEYRENIIEKAKISNITVRENKRYNHYKRLTEDMEYLEECKRKGLRLRQVPEEFVEKLKELIKK